MIRLRYAITVAAALVFAATPVFAGGLLTLPPATVIVTHGSWNQGSSSTLDITLSSVPEGAAPGFHVWGKTFAGWCLEDNSRKNAPAGSALSLLDSTDGDPLTCGPGDYPGVPWDQINYLLNHPGGSAGNILATVEDVQAAVWIVAGTDWDGTFAITPEVNDLVTDVQINGAGFTPSGDDVVAVILCSDGLGPDPYQDTIIEVTLSKTTHIFSGGFEDGDMRSWSARSN